MIFATGVAMLTSAYPPGKRGRVLGINVSATYLGLSLGPFLGGFLTQRLGWRSIFALNACLGLVVAGLVFTRVKGDWAEARGDRFDGTGAMILAGGLVALMMGLGRLPGGMGALLAATGLAVLAAFIIWETKAPSPLLDIGLFRRNTVFAFSNLAALINYSATTASGFLLSLYLQEIKGLTPQQAGLVLIAQPAMMALFSPLAGRLSDRVEPRNLASTGMAVSAAGLFMLTGLGAGTPTSLVVAALLVLGFGFALFSSPNTNAVMGAVEKRSLGVASAVLGTMRLTGGMLSMGAAMLIFNLFIGKVRITPEVHPQFLSASRIAILFFAVLCVGGVFASHARGRLRGGGSK
jgi:MFS family permease